MKEHQIFKRSMTVQFTKFQDVLVKKTMLSEKFLGKIFLLGLRLGVRKTCTDIPPMLGDIGVLRKKFLKMSRNLAKKIKKNEN